MSDIIERLRAMEPAQANGWQIAREAADEIERLRAVLQTIAYFAPGHGDVCEIIARRARAALGESEG